jgi:hypothetical protein
MWRELHWALLVYDKAADDGNRCERDDTEEHQPEGVVLHG